MNATEQKIDVAALKKAGNKLVHDLTDFLGLLGSLPDLVLNPPVPSDGKDEQTGEIPPDAPETDLADIYGYTPARDYNLPVAVINLIKRVLSVFETGRTTGGYEKITIYPDGIGGSKQITYGRFQTTEQGNLKTLLDDYLQAYNNGDMPDDPMIYAAARIVEDRLPKVGKTALWNDDEFVNALRTLGTTDLMARVQEEFFDRVYFAKAYDWFLGNGFTLPLSFLVIVDSFIHSGSILTTIRNKFAEMPPATGGDEKKWIAAYVKARKSWLQGKGGLLSKTVYRMNCFQDAMSKNNWDLTQSVNANGTIIKL